MEDLTSVSKQKHSIPPDQPITQNTINSKLTATLEFLDKIATSPLSDRSVGGSISDRLDQQITKIFTSINNIVNPPSS